MPHQLYDSILKHRGLTKPTNPIWKMNISPEEQSALAETLHNAYMCGELDQYGKEAALYYAVWWQRTYSGGSPSREMIAESAGIPSEDSNTLYKAAREAMHNWGFKPIHDTRYHFFRSLLLQGGLPMNHVVNNKGNFNNYSVFLKSLVKDMSNLNTEFTADIVPKLSCVSYLPKSFCNNSIYEISVQIAHAIIEDREDLLPYDSSKQGELKDLTSSLRQTAKQAQKERSRKPLSFTWELVIEKGILTMNYHLNNIANIGSDMVQGLNPRECFSFDVFISRQYIATYKRVSLEIDDYGHAHGVYHRMTFNQRHFRWNGESYIELKIIPNEGDSLFASALNCYPPDFSIPQQFQKINDCYVQQHSRQSEDNIVITTEEWKSGNTLPKIISFNGGSLLCYSFKETLALINNVTGEVIHFNNTFAKYSAVFGGIYIPWLESSNYKLLNRVPDIEVYDENSQRVERKLYSVSFRKVGDLEWTRLSRNVNSLPFGLVEFKIKFPDDHEKIERFYNIGNMAFFSSKETVNSADIRFFSSHGEAIIQNTSGIDTTTVGNNNWKITKDGSASIAPTISFQILHEGDPALHLDLPAPFKGITLVDSLNKEVKEGDIISADNLYSYRIISHGIASPGIRISYVKGNGEEGREAITGTVGDGITPLSNFEEPIQRMYDLYVNDYTDEKNFVSLTVNGKSVKIRRFAYSAKISDDFTTVEVCNVNNQEEENTVKYNGSIKAINCNIEQSVENIDVITLERTGNHAFTFPEGTDGSDCIIFSDKFDERKIIPQLISVNTSANYFEQIKKIWHDSEWSEKLDEEQIDNGNHWQMAIRFFEVASEYRLPFKAIPCINEIMEEPIRLAKFMFSMFINGKQGLFVSEVNRLEQEYAIGIHWIRSEEWQEAFASFISIYSQVPAILGMLLPKLTDFIRETLNSTLDSDYTDVVLSYIMGQDIGNATKLSIPEMQELRSRSVGKTDANNDLPRLEIKLHGCYYTEQAKRGMTFYQLTMIKAPIRIVEHLRGIGPDLWHDNSDENLNIRRVINFYRTYFTTVYSQILGRILKYTNKNSK